MTQILFNNHVFDQFPVLETPRIRLRAFEMADKAPIFRIFSDPVVLLHLGRQPFLVEAEAAFLIATIHQAFQDKECIRWALENKEDGTYMGSIGFWRILKEHRRSEIGYELSPDYWKKGYMHEALSRILRYGFEEMKLHSVEANVSPGNSGSEELLRRNGFIQEGYFKENFYGSLTGKEEKGFLDTVSFSLRAS
jgi:ribosomal-protein-alanine N-acetyltransferase